MRKTPLFICLLLFVNISFSACEKNKYDCETEKIQISKRINEINHCRNTSDCKVEYFGCPFGCFRLVNSSENVVLIKEEISDFVAACGQCEYKCGRPPSEERLECVNKKCSVRTFDAEKR